MFFIILQICVTIYIILQVKEIERALLDAYQVHPTVFCQSVKVSAYTRSKMCTVIACEVNEWFYIAVERMAPFTFPRRNLKTHCSFIPTVRPSVMTSASRKRSFSETLFKPEEYLNAPAFRFRAERKKMKLLDNVGITMIRCRISPTKFTSNTNINCRNHIYSEKNSWVPDGIWRHDPPCFSRKL